MNWQQMALSILGASVVGYITNWVAIRMLFRPLQEKRLWGWRIPFTPGVIPRGKARLARSIGEVVGGLLLTEEKVLQHLLRPEVEEQMRLNLASGLVKLQERGGSIGEALGDPGGESSFFLELNNQVAGLAVNWARGDSARLAVQQLAQETAEHLLDQRVAALVDGPGGLAGTLERLPEAILQQPAVQQGLQRRVVGQIESFLNSSQPVRFYLPGAVHEGMHHFIDDQAPRIITAIEEFVNSPAAREAIKDRIEGFFDSSTVKRFLSSIFQLMGNSADALVQRLAEEVTRFLADPQNREEFVGQLHTLAEEALGKSISEISAGLGEAGKREKAAEIAAWAMDKLNDPAVAAALSGAVKEILVYNRSRTWREIINQVNPASLAELPAALNRLVDQFWAREALFEHVEDLVRRELASAWQLPLRRALDYLPVDFAADSSGLATRLYRYLVRKVVPGLLRFVDIRSIVRQRVEELDELQVEGMLLDIMRRELVAITWLGALLGAFLGVVTVIMQYMMK